VTERGWKSSGEEPAATARARPSARPETAHTASVGRGVRPAPVSANSKTRSRGAVPVKRSQPVGREASSVQLRDGAVERVNVRIEGGHARSLAVALPPYPPPGHQSTARRTPSVLIVWTGRPRWSPRRCRTSGREVELQVMTYVDRPESRPPSVSSPHPRAAYGRPAEFSTSGA